MPLPRGVLVAVAGTGNHIISSEDIEMAEILPLYYTRQQVGQVFDLGKNNAKGAIFALRNQM